MARHWDEEGEEALIDDAMRVLFASFTIDELLDLVRRLNGRTREAAMSILRPRTREALPMSGVPCAEYDWNGREAAPEVAVEDEGMQDEPPSRPL